MTREIHNISGAQNLALQRAFPGKSEMAQRMRGFDWSRSVVGSPGCWQEPLLTSVRICLSSRYPIVIWWGQEALTTFYNDGYIPILGAAKHPGWLGQSAKECWSEIWHIIDPMLKGVFATGEATWSEDFLYVLRRQVPREEGYFTFSYGPIWGDAGEVGGIFCAVTETTARVIGERRLRTLNSLGATVLEAESAQEACEIASRTLATNAADIPFSFLYLVDDEEPIARLTATTGVAADVATRLIDLNVENTAEWPLRKVFERNAAELIPDLGSRFPALPGGPWPEPAEAALVLPIKVTAQIRPTGFLVAGLSPRRVIDADYRTFLEVIAGQIATAIANARAYEGEKRRATALAELDLLKTAFFSNVSHEFRTPLTLMLGPLEEILSNAYGALPAEAAAALTLVQRNSLRLLKLVNTLLDFARIEAGRIEAKYEPTDLSTFTAELASNFRSAIDRAGLHLRLDLAADTHAYVDRDMWEKIVLNLLSNALKFTFDGEICVSLQPTGTTAELTVTDTGVGIPAADLPRLFDRFYRVKNARSRTHEGAGIGLALVKELVNLHGGTIRAESQEGRGTQFVIDIPLGSKHLPTDRICARRERTPKRLGTGSHLEESLRWIPEPSRTAFALEPQMLTVLSEVPLPPPAAEVIGARVLFADDNADMREYVQRLLGEHYRIEAVADGVAALARIEADSPDLLLADVMMPGLDGFALLAKLRADPRTRSLPVILLSARAGEEARIEGLRAGADAYLVKPFSGRELIARIASQLELAEVRRASEKALRFRSEQHATLLNQAPMGIYLVDADFHMREVNPIARRTFGDLPGSLEGRDFAEIMRLVWEHSQADELVRIFRRTLETGEPHVEPESARFRTDRQVTEYLEWRIDRILLPDGRYGVVCYFRDISADVRARDALRDADRQKDEFLAMLAHELRNPLASIQNASALLAKSAALDSPVRFGAEVIGRQVKQLTRLVDDSLDVSRVSQGRIPLEKKPLNLNEVIAQAAEGVDALFVERQHNVSIVLPDQPLYVSGDNARLVQCVINMLTNSAKYTDAGGRIDVRLFADGPTAFVSVSDNGIGIAPDLLPRVFDLFVQSKRTLDRSQGGLGIGLSVVKRLVEMHGGRVEARSAGLGKGATFTIQLPLIENPITVSRETERPSPDGQRILIVDDNIDIADTLAMLLEMQGHTTAAVYTSADALQKAAAFEPDAVLLDIGLPDMNGYEVAHAIRLMPKLKNVRLIALTGYGRSEDQQRSLTAGFDAHLTKPVEPSTLTQALTPPRHLNSGAHAPPERRPKPTGWRD